jgi:hypothetical protein
MAEWFKAPVLKTGRGFAPSWVRIPLLPPDSTRFQWFRGGAPPLPPVLPRTATKENVMDDDAPVIMKCTRCPATTDLDPNNIRYKSECEFIHKHLAETPDHQATNIDCPYLGRDKRAAILELKRRK